PPQIPTISVHGSTLRHLPPDPHVHHTMPGIGSVTRTAQQYPYHSPSMCRALGPPLGPSSCDIDDTRPSSPSSSTISPVLSYMSSRDGEGIQFDTASCDPPWDTDIHPMLPSQISEATGKSDVVEEDVGVRGPQPVTVVEGSLETLPSHVRLRGTGSATRSEGGPKGVAEKGSEVQCPVATSAAITPQLLPPTPLERVHSYMSNVVDVIHAPDVSKTGRDDDSECIEAPVADVESLPAFERPLEWIQAHWPELIPFVSIKQPAPLDIAPDHPTTTDTLCTSCAPAPPTPRGAGLDWWIS
ncbi:hypothetical protein KIPB_015116, partial [Kipferlia bialata]